MTISINICSISSLKVTSKYIASQLQHGKSMGIKLISLTIMILNVLVIPLSIPLVECWIKRRNILETSSQETRLIDISINMSFITWVTEFYNYKVVKLVHVEILLKSFFCKATTLFLNLIIFTNKHITNVLILNFFPIINIGNASQIESERINL